MDCLYRTIFGKESLKITVSRVPLASWVAFLFHLGTQLGIPKQALPINASILFVCIDSKIFMILYDTVFIYPYH